MIPTSGPLIDGKCHLEEWLAEGGMPDIVMELLEGEDLRSRLERWGMLSLREASIIHTQACKALALASKAGII